MTINITMKNEKNKYGYLANVPTGLAGESGQTSDLGSSNQSSLTGLFGHDNKFLGTNDSEIAAKFLRGREYIYPESFSEETVGAAIEVINSKIDARTTIVGLQGGNIDTDPILIDLNSDLTFLSQNINDEGISTEELAALVEGDDTATLSAYNPDFSPGEFSYNYAENITRLGSDRANDLFGTINAAVSTTPNINYPNLNPDYNNWEVQATNPTQDTRGIADRRGGFGPTLTTTQSSDIVINIIDKYI